MENWEHDHNVRVRREQMQRDGLEETTAILMLAGLKPERMWELANGYWPNTPAYDDVRRPWWLAQTSVGLIQIGWRKRVLAIDWSATGIAIIVTTDEVTKDTTMVHAYSQEKAVEYLKKLREAGER
jgi:hypothetical protein